MWLASPLPAPASASAPASAPAFCWAVDLLGGILPGGVQLLHGHIYRCHILVLVGFFQLMQGIVDGLLHAITQLVAVFTQLLLGLEYEAVCTVELVNLSLASLSVAPLALASSLHALDLIVAQTGTGLYADALPLPVPLSSHHVQDTVGINIKGHLDLRGSATGGRNAIQYKPTDGAVVFGHTALSLQNMYLYRGLVIGRSRKHLALLGRNGRVALYELGKYTAQGLDTEAQRGYVEQ